MSSSNSSSPLTQISRRDFLAVGGAGVMGLSAKSSTASRAGSGGAVIQILLNGGASHLETFDPKPHAPREIRGPLHSIATRIPSVRFSECLPKLADRADRLVVLRSLFHDVAPIHETGDQLLRTGHLKTRKETPVSIGVTVQQQQGGNRRFPAAVEIRDDASLNQGSRREIDDVGLAHLSHLKDWGVSVPDFQRANPRVREAYGVSQFGERLWTAVRLVESGCRYVLVNTFDEIEGHRTWDAHGDPNIGPATVFDYRDRIGPQFDAAFAAMMDDLQGSGLWKQTFVICAGEMGRSPRMNEEAGRDHWTQAWSGLLAGGSLEGGQVVGETDEMGESVLNHPLPVSELPWMALEFLGISPQNQEPIA